MRASICLENGLLHPYTAQKIAAQRILSNGTKFPTKHGGTPAPRPARPEERKARSEDSIGLNPHPRMGVCGAQRCSSWRLGRGGARRRQLGRGVARRRRGAGTCRSERCWGVRAEKPSENDVLNAIAQCAAGSTHTKNGSFKGRRGETWEGGLYGDERRAVRLRRH